jgi:hypothetical protein
LIIQKTDLDNNLASLIRKYYDYYFRKSKKKYDAMKIILDKINKDVLYPNGELDFGKLTSTKYIQLYVNVKNILAEPYKK